MDVGTVYLGSPRGTGEAGGETAAFSQRRKLKDQEAKALTQGHSKLGTVSEKPQGNPNFQIPNFPLAFPLQLGW